MKSKLTLALILCLALYLPTMGQGQGRGMRNMDPEQMAERQTNMMKEQLELTAEQLPKIEELNLKYAKKMGEVREEVGEDREAMREKIMPLMQEKDTELKKILTAEQWAKFEEERKERMKNRGSGRRRGL